MRAIFYVACSFLLSFLSEGVHAQILKKQPILDKFSFWQNQDWDWYKKNIPFFESPDQEMDLTYYYRWEMMTAHMVYGSGESGYAFTEFIDRPWWSAKYGAISCAAGHQLYETRWLRDQRYAKDYASYWFNTSRNQIRNYTTWLADAIWQSYKVHYDQPFVLRLKDDLIKNFEGWEKDRWVPSESMFAWDGMHDGMETNINSRQTKQWFDGAPGYRPTLNSYMWADANAIAGIAALEGDNATRILYLQKAAVIKKNLQEKCWDPERQFFFHRFKNDEEGGIKANTLTYQTGKYAGNKHGREAIGFIPWYFNLPDPGFESAWKFLMDPNYFYSPFGPTTVEKQDPLFNIAKNCCAWSGNAWPFATAQTLKGMANLIKNYQQSYISKDDYFHQLKIFSVTQRKNGLPYIAEANHPETGSWDGHDVIGHSDHYFHSAYIDEIITGLMGLTPKETDSIEVNPLIPENWDYAALDDVSYHGHTISILWDKHGTRYKKGKGLMIIADGKIIAASPVMKKLAAPLPAGIIPAFVTGQTVNYAVNNEPNQYYPRIIASFPGVGNNSYQKMNDGQYWYYNVTTNRWSSLYSKNNTHWAGVDFGAERPVHTVKIYFTEDSAIKAPSVVTLQYWNGQSWIGIQNAANKGKILSRRATSFTFNTIKTSRIRALLHPQNGMAVAISEFETWGPYNKDLPKPGAPQLNESNLASKENATIEASFISRFDRLSTLNDGNANPVQRWTAFESPHAADSITFHFKKPTTLNTAYLFFFSDNGGIQPPAGYEVECFQNGQWVKVSKPVASPEKHVQGLNIISFERVNTTKIRFIFRHKSAKAFTGLYEIEMRNE